MVNNKKSYKLIVDYLGKIEFDYRPDQEDPEMLLCVFVEEGLKIASHLRDGTAIAIIMALYKQMIETSQLLVSSKMLEYHMEKGVEDSCDIP